MKNYSTINKFIFILLIGSGIFFFVCAKDTQVTQLQSPLKLLSSTFSNLIQNPNFENGTGQFSLNHWYLDGMSLPDTNIFSSQDVPVGGGNWSLMLPPAGPPPSEVALDAYITGQSGTNIYSFTFYKKRIGNGAGGSGVSIGEFSQNAFYPSKSIMNDTTYGVWKKYTIVDTLTTLTTDTILIRLSGGTCQSCSQTIYFDLIEVTTEGN